MSNRVTPEELREIANTCSADDEVYAERNALLAAADEIERVTAFLEECRSKLADARNYAATIEDEYIERVASLEAALREAHERTVVLGFSSNPSDYIDGNLWLEDFLRAALERTDA